MAKLSESIASRGGTILAANVFVPENKDVFYSRRSQMNEDFSKLSQMYAVHRSVVRVPDQDPKYKIGVLASKQDHCLIDLLHQWQDGKLPLDIACVISNHERGPNTGVCRFLERHGIPYHYLHTTKENKRQEEILELVQDTDFLVLARYMQAAKGFSEQLEALERSAEYAHIKCVQRWCNEKGDIIYEICHPLGLESCIY